jgi:hypothetical protein
MIIKKIELQKTYDRDVTEMEITEVAKIQYLCICGQYLSH